jgi:VanZ family protein
MKRWYFAGVWLAVIAFVIWLADTSRAKPLFEWIEHHPGSDKVGHFFLIGGMAFFANLALRGRNLARIQIGSLFVAAVFVAEEFTQKNIPSRTFDWRDLAADFVGIMVFDILSRCVLRKSES